MSWKAAYSALAALTAGLYFTAPLPAADQNPPWQEPPTSRSFHAWASQSPCAGDCGSTATPAGPCGPACGAAAPCDPCDDACCGTGDLTCGPCCGLSSFPRGDWIRVDALLWWTKGAAIPPLLTTSPDTTSKDKAGVLGQSTTTILLGNEELNKDLRGGYRISFGTWLDGCDSLGIEFGYFGLGQSTSRFDAASTGSPILVRPFFNTDTGAESNYLIAYPSAQQGSFSAISTSNFQVAEFLTRCPMARSPAYRIELLGGLRFQQLTDALDIGHTTGPGVPSQNLQVLDQFRTRNDFYGGQLGIATQWHQCYWSFETNMKLALGSTYSRIDINGTTTKSDGTTLSGGMLALPSNMGPHASNQFSIIPELGLTLGYDLTCHLRTMVTYTFMYWSPVSRPGDQIDLNVSPAQFPPPQAGSSKPEFVQHTTDFWAQGINLGLDYRF